MICPVPPDEDCPVKWFFCGLLLLVLGAYAIAGVSALFQPVLDSSPPPVQVTPEKEPQPGTDMANPFSGELPLYAEHWETCEQCRKPLINTDGEESGGMCETGFELFKQDIRNSKK
jgi:hypothetical protein